MSPNLVKESTVGEIGLGKVSEFLQEKMECLMKTGTQMRKAHTNLHEHGYTPKTYTVGN
jgi:hypothetical protein